MNDFDPEVHYHKTDYEDNLEETESDLIALISDAIADLDNHSMLNNDKYASEISEFEKILENAEQRSNKNNRKSLKRNSFQKEWYSDDRATEHEIKFWLKHLYMQVG